MILDLPQVSHVILPSTFYFISVPILHGDSIALCSIATIQITSHCPLLQLPRTAVTPVYNGSRRLYTAHTLQSAERPDQTCCLP